MSIDDHQMIKTFLIMLRDHRTKTDYGGGERFTFTFFMLLVQCSLGWFVGLIGKYMKTNKFPINDK